MLCTHNILYVYGHMVLLSISHLLLFMNSEHFFRLLFFYFYIVFVMSFINLIFGVFIVKILNANPNNDDSTYRVN